MNKYINIPRLKAEVVIGTQAERQGKVAGGGGEGLRHLLSIIFLNSTRIRYPRHSACVRVIRVTSFSSLISSNSPRSPALKNTCIKAEAALLFQQVISLSLSDCSP